MAATDHVSCAGYGSVGGFHALQAQPSTAPVAMAAAGAGHLDASAVGKYQSAYDGVG